MKLSFKRITSSGSFIPEIDGLRFIAIVSVVLFHLSGFLIQKDVNRYTDNVDYSFLKRLLSHGDLGVPLFFIISGFILAIPFAKFYIGKESPVNLKKYFLRRLTRLEPPYILIMTFLLLGAVYVAKVIPLERGIGSYLSSIIYSHNFIYGKGLQPLLNAPAWSLEIEVQFYILAPLIAYILSVKSTSVRRFILICTVIVFLIFNYFNKLPFISLINYFQYFIVGFLLADLYISNSRILRNTKFDHIIALFLFVIIWLFEKKDFEFFYQKLIWEFIQLTSIFFLYYYVLFHKVFKLLSLRVITNIGGMCYSIYLLHNPIISLFGNHILKWSFSKYSFLNTLIYSILLIGLIMVISSLFFLLIEKPCMNKDWYTKILKRSKPGSPVLLVEEQV